MKRMSLGGAHNVGVSEFGSLGEMIAYATAVKCQWADEVEAAWSGGTKSVAEAANLAVKGWHDVRPEVDREVAAVAEQLRDRLEVAFQTRHDIVGGVVDVGRFAAGMPDCMLDFVPEPSARIGKVVRLFVDYGASGRFNPSYIRRRGVIVLALVDALKTLGVSVEVWGESAVTGRRGEVHTTVVKLHDATEPLDIDSLMFALAHPSMLRRLTFAVRERATKEHNANIGQGMGATRKMLFAKEYGADIYMERLEDAAHNMLSNPVDWVMQTVTGLGLVEGGE